MTTQRLLIVAVFAAFLFGCSMHGGQAIPTESSSLSRVSDEAHWRNALALTFLPEAGCFTTTYPSTTWTRVACSDAINDTSAPAPPLALHAHEVGGASGQLEAYINPPATIEEAIGSFPAVSGVTSEYSKFLSTGSVLGPNTFTLQLNSQKFPTAACGGQSGCLGWEQFVFGNHPPGGTVPSRIYIQNWLLATGSATLNCPKHWAQSKRSCLRNSTMLTVPYVSISSLATLSIEGRAESRGDSVFLTIGKTAYAVRNAQRDTWVDLAAHWGEVQFDVLGDGGGSQAIFNRGSTVTVQLQIKTAATPPVRPLCVLDSSTTAESNNMNYASIPAIPAAAQFPSIVYAESNARKAGNAQCRSLDPAP